MVKRESPRIRRLRTDFKTLWATKSESSILDFQVSGNPADVYQICFHGRGLWRPEGSVPQIRERHEVTIRLGASYPRMMPELTWRTPIFHPNISASGVVCLGGYGSHWVPSLNLDALCLMLWDMVRYKNLDVESPYNREAATWVKTQDTYAFPVDARPLRDRLAGAVRSGSPESNDVSTDVVFPGASLKDGTRCNETQQGGPEEIEIVDAELVDPADAEILFIE